jgi:hypothetical protein
MGSPGIGAAGMTGVPLPLRRPPRADPVAAALLLVGGALCIWQLLLPWRTVTVDSSSVAGTDVSVSGWQVYRLLRSVPDSAADANLASYCVLGTAVGGGALMLLGAAMMMAINHRPLGLAALLVSGACVAGAGWLLISARTIFDVGLFTLFAQAQAGWYLFLGAGFVGLAGAWKALATG